MIDDETNAQKRISIVCQKLSLLQACCSQNLKAFLLNMNFNLLFIKLHRHQFILTLGKGHENHCLHPSLGGYRTVNGFQYVQVLIICS